MKKWRKWWERKRRTKEKKNENQSKSKTKKANPGEKIIKEEDLPCISAGTF